MKKRKKRIAVLMGGPSAEHEISIKTGNVILKNIDKQKYTAFPIIISKKGEWSISKNKPTKIGQALDWLKENTDLVFIAMHGAPGEDGTIQGCLETFGIPYTASGVLASAVGMDKITSSKILAMHGLKIPKQMEIAKTDWRKNQKNILKKIVLPCVIKPSDSGSSVGVSIIKKKKDIKKGIEKALTNSAQILVQEYIKGREVTCAVIEDKGKAIALPPTEIIPKSEFFDYKAKYAIGGSEEITPARLSKSQTKKVQTSALEAHHAIGCRAMSRTDFILRGSDLFILEINTIPGMTEMSLLPQAAKAAGISFPELLEIVIDSARANEA